MLISEYLKHSALTKNLGRRLYTFFILLGKTNFFIDNNFHNIYLSMFKTSSMKITYNLEKLYPFTAVVDARKIMSNTAESLNHWVLPQPVLSIQTRT